MRLDERGKQCPLPVIDTKKALAACASGELVEVIVDNEIAVQNLRKMAGHKGLECSFEKTGYMEFVVRIKSMGRVDADNGQPEGGNKEVEQTAVEETLREPESGCRRMVVVLASNEMGQGDGILGKILMKGFIYALTQQDTLPETVILYNSGAYLSCEGSDNLEDLKALEVRGVEVLTCGTCLNHYKLGEKLKVGTVTNMYEIVERMTGAGVVVRP